MRPAHSEPASETSRARAHQRLAAQHAVARIVAEAESLASAGPSILQAICECLDWDVGALWIVDRDAHRIRCVETWLAPGVTAPAFVAASRALVAEAGQGLPGHAWQLGKPVWIDDLPEAGPVFVRGDVAAREGLHGAIAFPIVLDNEVLGVMDFLTHEIRRPDTDVLEMLSTFGSQIGQFIERKHVEEALRASEQRLQAIIDQANAANDASLAVLSARERQVLQLITESKTNLEIGQILHISPHTVDTHRRKMMEKLDLHNVVDLVKFAIRNGLARVDGRSRQARPRRGRSTAGCSEG